MILLVINISLFAIMSVLASFLKNKKILFAMYVLSCLFLLFIMCFRDESVGTDLVAYKNKFELLVDMPFRYIFQPGMYSSSLADLEYGFVFLTRLIAVFTNDYKVYIVIVSLLIFVPILISFYYLSNNPFLSVLLFISLQFMNFCASGLRQALAISICFLSVAAFLKNKKILAFCLIILAFTFHKTALVFLLLFATKIKWNSRALLIYAFVFLFLFIFKAQMYSLFSFVFGYSNDYQYDISQTNSYGLLLISSTFTIIGFLTLNDFKNDIKNICLFSLVSFASLAMIFVLIGHNSARIAFYFYIMSCIFLPNVLKLPKSFNNTIISICICIFGVAYYFISTWQLYGFVDFHLWL